MREFKEAKLNGEKTMEKNEERKEDWIQENLTDLKENFMKETFNEKSDEFKEYCEERWNEDGE